MRVYLLWLVIVGLCIYAQRDYFKSACVLVMLMAIYKHPDMPTNVAGIQGLNPWNLLMIFTVIGYFVNKGKEGAVWDLDGKVTFLFLAFYALSMTSSYRMLSDIQTLLDYGWDFTKGEIVSEYFVNQTKWLIPAYLIFVGARTEERRKLALIAILATHMVIALIVIRRIPVSSIATGMELTQKGLKVLNQAFGWSRVNTAMLLAGAPWAFFWATNYVTGGKYRWMPWTFFAIGSLALALTGGRMGWGTWVALGGIYSAWRWRKGILLLPLAMLLVVAFVPSVQQRLMQGLNKSDTETQAEDALTSGRTEAWPIAIQKIELAPWIGYGGHAMIRTGAAAEVARKTGLTEDDRGFPHPHNAYLRIMMDSGILGTIPILLLYMIVVRRAFKICGVGSPEATAIGMTTISLVLALMIAAMGSQNFFPVQGSMAMWASVALTLRVYTDQVRNHAPEEVKEFEALWKRARSGGYAKG